MGVWEFLTWIREGPAAGRLCGITTCVSVEKSGQPEFDFEYGDDFGRGIQEAGPTFAKTLVRYNPDRDSGMNQQQRQPKSTF